MNDSGLHSQSCFKLGPWSCAKYLCCTYNPDQQNISMRTQYWFTISLPLHACSTLQNVWGMQTAACQSCCEHTKVIPSLQRILQQISKLSSPPPAPCNTYSPHEMKAKMYLILAPLLPIWRSSAKHPTACLKQIFNAEWPSRQAILLRLSTAELFISYHKQ